MRHGNLGDAGVNIDGSIDLETIGGYYPKGPNAGTGSDGGSIDGSIDLETIGGYYPEGPNADASAIVPGEDDD